LDSSNHSTDNTPTKEDAATETNPNIQPHSLAQFRIPVETNKQEVVILHGRLIPYLKNGLDVAHVKQYWSYYVHILPGNNLSSFPAFTEENIQDFFYRLNKIRQEVLTIGRDTFSGHTRRGQPINTLKN
jgi:hypothetical protein